MKIGDKIFCLDYQNSDCNNDDIKYRGGLLKKKYRIYNL